LCAQLYATGTLSSLIFWLDAGASPERSGKSLLQVLRIWCTRKGIGAFFDAGWFNKMNSGSYVKNA